MFVLDNYLYIFVTARLCKEGCVDKRLRQVG